MLIVHVSIAVKKECIPQFIAASIANAIQSNTEAGICRFDLIQDENTPENFMLIEVYTSPDAPAAHKETAHYKLWRDTVEPMMARPRSNVKYNSLFTKDTDYAV